jgi:hypothetical protein
LLPVSSASAAETVSLHNFDGSDFIDSPSSPSVQLAQFVVEVRFKAGTASPDQTMFLVSKGAGKVESVILDHNFAISINKLGKLVAGFKASDGSTHYVSTESSVLDSKWHLARIIYDGIKLKLRLDGTPVATSDVGKFPDKAGDGPLRIGANANSKSGNGFFVGAVDYVKVLDRATFKKVYFEDFGPEPNPGPGPGPDPGPDPGPNPNPTTSDCAKMPMRDVKAVVFLDPILSKREGGGMFNAPGNYVGESMRHMKLYGINTIRVPFYWEAYVNTPTMFLDELEYVAGAAERNNICVIFDNHHWYTSSYWDINIVGNSDGRGFPSFILKGFPAKNNYEATAGPFWKAFLKNDIQVAGKKVWDIQAEFFSKVIQRTDGYKNVIGYEIINEPHLFDPTMYDDLGKYHTYMAKKIRAETDKKIFFNRETARGFMREPDSEVKIVPFGVPGIVYGPHLYAVPFPGTNAEKQIENFKQWSKEWNMEIFVGEWSADTDQELGLYLKAFEENGFGWAYYSWKPTQSRGGGNSLYDSATTAPTPSLYDLGVAINKVY